MKNSTKPTYISLFFIAMAISIFCFLFFNAIQLQHISIDIETTQMGNIRVFWAGQDEPFSRSNSSVKRVPKGRRQVDFIIQNPARIHHLRIAPSFYHSYVSIHKINIESPRLPYQPVIYPQYKTKTAILAGIDNVKMSDHLKFRVAEHGPKLQIDLQSFDGAVDSSLVPFWITAGVSLGCALLLIFLFRWIAIIYPPGFRLLLFIFTIMALWMAIDFKGIVIFQPNIIMVALTSLMFALVLADVPFLIREKLAGANPFYSPGQLPFVALMIAGVFLASIYAIPTSSRIITNYSKRELSESEEGTGSNFTTYFNNRFIRGIPYKDDLLYVNALIKVFGFGYSPTSKVLLGQENHFFEGYGERRVEGDVIKSYDNVSDYIGAIPFSTKELEQWAQALNERKAWLEKKGIPYIFVLAPTKAQIYPEKLPKALQKLKQRLRRPARYDQLVQYLKENTRVPFVDLRSALLDAKKIRDYPSLFYKTDFHWNYYGAFYAYREVVEQINRHYPKLGLVPLHYDNFVLKVKKKWAHPQFLKLVGLDPIRHQFDHYFSLKPKKGTPLDTLNIIPERGISDVKIPQIRLTNGSGTDFPLKNIQNPLGKLENILILGDSFIGKTLLYFSAHAKNTMHIRAVEQFPTSVYDYVKPDIVIQEMLNMYILRKPIENPPELNQS